jgi:hypothetical protein
MTILQKEIDNLTEYCKILIFQDSHLDAGDIVQDALIELMETGAREYDLVVAKYILRNVVMRARQTFVPASFKPSKQATKTTTRLIYCKSCKESIPSNGFYAIKSRGLPTVSSLCKKCTSKKVMASIKKNKTKYNLRMKKWRDANPKRQRALNQASEKFAKENLTDTYCKKFLRYKHTPAQIKDNPELIEQVRQRLLAKSLTPCASSPAASTW